MGIDKYTMDRYGSSEAASGYHCKLCNLRLAAKTPKFVVSSKELSGSRLVQTERILCPTCYDSMQMRVYNKTISSNPNRKRSISTRKANILKLVG